MPVTDPSLIQSDEEIEIISIVKEYFKGSAKALCFNGSGEWFISGTTGNDWFILKFNEKRFLYDSLGAPVFNLTKKCFLSHIPYKPLPTIDFKNRNTDNNLVEPNKSLKFVVDKKINL